MPARQRVTVARGSEGSASQREGIEYTVKSSEVQRVRKNVGRPKGSLNKPKSLVPTELANQLLLTLEDQVPAEHFRYIRSVVKEGKAISTKNELDVLILLLGRNLWPALLAEQKTTGEEGDSPVFRKDVTERLKVLNSLLGLRNQIDKGEADKEPDGDQPLVRIYADRSIRDRLGVLVGYQPSGPSRDLDQPERGAFSPRTISDQVSERQFALPAGEQVPSDRVLDGDSGGGVRESAGSADTEDTL